MYLSMLPRFEAAPIMLNIDCGLIVENTKRSVVSQIGICENLRDIDEF